MGELAYQHTQTRNGDLAFPGSNTRVSARPTRVSGALPQVLRTLGNQSMQRLLQVKPDDLQALSSTKEVTPFVPDFSQIWAHPKSLGTIQTKLTVSPPGDIYEQEADRVAEQVMRMPEPQREHACACGGGCPECQSEQPDQENVRLQTKRLRSSDLGQTAVPPIVHEVLRSPGRPLDLTARAFMEPRFGHDFSHVRVHTNAKAADSAQAVKALAYTVGRDVVFGAGKYAPQSVEGRWLLAHELTHTLQQSRGSLAIQRFVPCTHAGLSLEECPRREPGEESESQHEPMIVEFITRPEVGYLIGNFGVGQSALKASAKTHPSWPQLITKVSQAGSQWQLWGLSDCHGEDQLNKSLRKQRADAVRAALPAAASANIVGADGASLDECITTNETRLNRARNRAVLITDASSTMGPATITSQTLFPPGPQTRTLIGVGEQVVLTYSAGTATWSYEMYPDYTGGLLSPTTGKNVLLTAPDTAQTVVVTAGAATIVFNVIPPSGIHMDRLGGGISHTVNRPNMGIQASKFLLPDTVNFYNVQYHELEVPRHATGIFDCPTDPGHHPNPLPIRMLNVVVPGKGTQANAIDCLYSGYCPDKPLTPWSVGSKTFAIPYEYNVGGGPFHWFATVTQQHALLPGNILTTSKAGAWAMTTVAAATSRIPGCP